MDEGVRDGSPDSPDPDAMLNALLECAEGAISDTQSVANAMPLFIVEAKPSQRLRDVLPGVRFSAQDIRAWAAEISS